MKNHVPLRAIIRQPVRLIIFLLLVGLASFGFVARAVEFVVINREITRIERFYRNTGTLVPMDAIANNNVYEAANLIAGSPYVRFDDRRTLVQGVMHDITNAMFGQHTVGGNQITPGSQPFDYKNLYAYDSIVIFNANTVRNRSVRVMTPQGPGDLVETLSLIVRVSETLHGHVQFPAQRQFSADFPIEATFTYPLYANGYFLARAIQQSGCLINLNATIDFFPLYDDVYFVPVSDTVAFEYALSRIQDDARVLDENTHALMITGTKDMTSLPLVTSGIVTRFQGRFFGYDDYVNQNPVIVLHQRMDSARRYARVGETITVTLRDMRTFVEGAPLPPPDHPMQDMIMPGVEGYFRNFPAGYWTAITSDYAGDWQNYDTITLELEVIGTYVIPDMWGVPRWTHIRDTFQTTEAFIPASLIPDGWGIVDTHIVSGQYSFVLRNPDDDIPFMHAHGAQLSEMGLNVQFFGEDPTNFLLSAVPIRNAIRLNMLLFSAVLLLVLILTVFIFLRGRYKEFAIMRALGVGQGSAVWQVVVPVILFWVPVSIGASIAAWHFALTQAAESLAILAEIGEPTDLAAQFVVRNILDRMRYEEAQAALRVIPQIDIRYLIWMCVGLVVAWVLAVFVGTLSFARHSMISLLQGANSGGAPRRRVKEGPPPKDFVFQNIGPVLDIRPAISAIGRLASIIRHHARHIFRVPVKTMLVAGMALLFLVSLGWLHRTIEFTESEIERLYATTVITGEIVNPSVSLADITGHDIPLESVRRLANSGYVHSLVGSRFHMMSFFGSFEDNMWNNDGVWIETTATPMQGVSPLFANVLFTGSLSDLYEAANRPAVFGAGAHEPFTIEFAPGFYPEMFESNYPLMDIVNVSYEEFNEMVAQWNTNQMGNIIEVEQGEAEVWRMPVIVHESLRGRQFLFEADTTVNDIGDGNFSITTNNRMRYLVDENNNTVFHPLELGGHAYIALHHGLQWVTPVVVAGFYSGGHPGVVYRARQGMVIGFDNVFDTYSTLGFTLEADQIHYMQEFVETMNEQLIWSQHFEHYHPGWGWNRWTNSFAHEVVLHDEEFRTVVVPLEESLHLLRVLYPVAQIMSVVFGLGLSLLLVLQNAKVAAILRVLGSPGYKVRTSLCLELLVVSITGMIIGFAIVLGMGVGVLVAMYLAGLYMSGAVVGALVGVFVISYKTPLELLQVRE